MKNKEKEKLHSFDRNMFCSHNEKNRSDSIKEK